MDTVEQRIAQLEQRLEQMGSALERAERAERTWRGKSNHAGRGMRLAQLAAACGVAVTIGALTMGTAAAKPGPQSLTVRAPFKVVGNSGQPFMGVDANGLLTIYRNRRPAVVLGPGEDAFGLVQVYSPSGDPVAELSALANGTGQLAVVGDEGQVARLGASPDVNNQLTLRFYQGKTVLAGVGGGKAGLLQINDASGKKMVLLGENGNGGTVGLYNPAGQNKILLATGATGHAEIDVNYGGNGVPAVRLQEKNTGGYLSITNTAGIERVAGGVLTSDRGFMQVYGPGGYDFIIGRK